MTLGPRPLVLITGTGIGGPHAWAERLRERMSATRQVLLAVPARDPHAPVQPDVAVNDVPQLCEWLATVPRAVVFPNWHWPLYAELDRLKAAGHDFRVVAYCRSDDEASYYQPLRDNARYFDWLVAVSERCRAECVRQMPEKADRVRLVRTFVDRPERLERRWQSGPIRLLYAGRLDRQQKRAQDVVEVAELLLKRDVHFQLRFVGDGPALPELKDRVEGLDHRGRIVFDGAVPHREMPAIFANSDVFLLPSSSEGVSNSLLEAMSNGCVPIATDIASGVADAIPSSLRGLLVPVGDAAAMADRVERLSRSVADLELLGRAAYRATEDFAWESYERRFTSLLAEIDAD